MLSTNWFNSVRDVLPRSYFSHGRLDFHLATNALAIESKRGDAAAQALWGFALVVLKSTPESTDKGLALLKDSAANGYVPAMLNLGFLLQNGTVIPANNHEAFEWFTQAAKLNNAEAQFHLGKCYHYGLGTPSDPTMAAKYYLLAARQTNYTAMKSLGALLMDGIGVKKDEEKAKHWLLRAANEGGNSRAMYNLGVLCFRHSDEPGSKHMAFEWFQKSAELGDPIAAQELSLCYFNGYGDIKPDLLKYREWRKTAALLGATDSQYLMGQAYRQGDGVPKDVEQSLFWLRKAAAKNHPDALYDLALHYLQNNTNKTTLETANEYMIRAAKNGHREAQLQCAFSLFRGDIDQDCEAASKWLLLAAENGWPNAEFLLFRLFYNGGTPAKGCPAYPKDKSQAIQWLRRAADHEFLVAQAVLAVMLIQGLDLQQNKSEAEKLLRNAAEHGFAPAQNDLGFAILNGDIISAYPLEAAMWCKLALSHPSDSNVLKRATYNAQTALSRLSDMEKDQVEEMVKGFKAKPQTQLPPKVRDPNKRPDYPIEDGAVRYSDP
jgi:TPR repeat protein